MIWLQTAAHGSEQIDPRPVQQAHDLAAVPQNDDKNAGGRAKDQEAGLQAEHASVLASKY